jgi:hypothetical protein
MEIPLPPLPAAQDRDPEAMRDTRPPKLPTPPPVRAKTELELMLEKHDSNNIPPGFSGSTNVVEVKASTLQPAYDMTMYAAYAAHWGPGFDPNAAAAACAIIPQTSNQDHPEQPEQQQPHHHCPEATLAALAEAVPSIDSAAEAISKAEEAKADEVDAEELAMLGIDPSDFIGFGQ